MKNKKAAMEMSVGTIVTIVLLMSVLILGLVLVRNIMCSGISITDDITESVEGEIKGLFGQQEYGVKCVGEEKIQKIGSNGDSKVLGCVVISEESGVYDFEISEIEKLEGNPPEEEIESWFSETEATGVSISAGENKENFITFTPPQNVDKTTIRIKVEVTKEGGNTETHHMRLEITPVGTLTSTVC